MSKKLTKKELVARFTLGEILSDVPDEAFKMYSNLLQAKSDAEFHKVIEDNNDYFDDSYEAFIVEEFEDESYTELQDRLESLFATFDAFGRIYSKLG